MSLKVLTQMTGCPQKRELRKKENTDTDTHTHTHTHTECYYAIMPEFEESEKIGEDLKSRKQIPILIFESGKDEMILDITNS